MVARVMWLLAVVVVCEAFSPSVLRTPPLRQRALGLPARDGGTYRRRRHRAVMLAEPAAVFDAAAAVDAAAATTALAPATNSQPPALALAESPPSPAPALLRSAALRRAHCPRVPLVSPALDRDARVSRQRAARAPP
jgi:hypothetical protein